MIPRNAVTYGATSNLNCNFSRDMQTHYSRDCCEVPRLLNIVRGYVTKLYDQSEKTNYQNERPDQYDFLVTFIIEAQSL